MDSGGVPQPEDAYPLGNTSWDWFRGAARTMADDGRDIDTAPAAFVGGTLYSHAYKHEHPDARVEAVEANPYSAALQSYAADRLAITGDPDVVRADLFLDPYTEGGRDGWQAISNAFWAPRDEVASITDRRESYIDGSDVFPDALNDGFSGAINSFYGMHEEAHHTDDDLVAVDLKRTKNDTYLHVLEEFDGVREPDGIHLSPVQDVDRVDAEIVFANNVPDWFDDMDAFAAAVDRVGSDDGYHLSCYTMPNRVRFDDPGDAAAAVERATGRDATPVETDAAGTLHELLPYRSTGDRPARYNTADIAGGDNGAVLRID